MTQREYIWLDDLPVAVVDQLATVPVIYYVHTDHLFRPVAMTNAAQIVAWSASYTPFGAVQTTNVQTTTLDLRFPGQWFELETGLHYNWHRHYDPTTGRYLQPDPLGFVDGPSVYSYAGGSPLARTDPDGQFLNELEAACLAGPNPVCVTGVIGDILTTIAGIYIITHPPAPPKAAVSINGCDSNDDDPCSALLRQISDRIAEIERRRSELLLDRYGLFNLDHNVGIPGIGSWTGHQTAYNNGVINLSRLVAQAKAKGCKIPPEAYKYLTMKAPASPLEP